MLAAPATPGDALVVLRFGGRRVPRSLRDEVVRDVRDGTDAGAMDAAVAQARRLIVLGDTAQLAAVLTRLLRAGRLDVEVAHPTGCRGIRNAKSSTAQRVPLIRDEAGQVLVGTAYWLPPGDEQMIEGEAIVDDTVLFDGRAAGVRIEPLTVMPGLRAAALGSRLRRRRWVAGRAVQLGTTGAQVLRDGVPDRSATRPVRRSTFYRHTEGWLRVG